MPMFCNFNTPSDKIKSEEYVQYIYAMRLWKLQDELGLSFEMASMYLRFRRSNVDMQILRFRMGGQFLDPVKLTEACDDMYRKYDLEVDSEEIKRWERIHNKRFIGRFGDGRFWDFYYTSLSLVEFCYLDQAPNLHYGPSEWLELQRRYETGLKPLSEEDYCVNYWKEEDLPYFRELHERIERERRRK